MHQELVLDVRCDGHGNKFLHFPFMTISDVHLGTKHCRAERLSRMLEHTVVDQFYLIGDIIDGEYMQHKWRWKFGHPSNSWHRQVVAHICRKAAQGTKVTYIPGNHDAGIRNRKVVCDGEERLHRNLCGKTIYGINIAEKAYYIDPLGHKFLLIHGDQYDRTLGKCSAFGDAALEVMQHIDRWFQRLPKCSHISLAAKGKRAVKTIVDRLWGIRKHIAEDVDGDPSLHGIITGHSHMSEISRTPGGKLLINDGCCTEHVEALAQDQYGTQAVLEWHKTYLKLKQEGGHVRTYTWKELGLDLFENKPQAIEDESTVRADRLIRLFYRMWPPRERLRARKTRQFADGAEGATYGSPAYIPLIHPHRDKGPYRMPNTSQVNPNQALAA
jgi:UDP-2,3-diacylglucosamine pyrophosphatase LpxH